MVYVQIAALIVAITVMIWVLIQILSGWSVEDFADCLAGELLAGRQTTALISLFAEQHANQASSDQGAIDAESCRTDPEMHLARRKSSADVVRARVLMAIMSAKHDMQSFTREELKGRILEALFKSEVPRIVVEAGRVLGKSRAQIESRLDPFWSVRFFR